MKPLLGLLNHELNAHLQVIDHPSFNQMFTGFSVKYQTAVFVKVFAATRVEKFAMERSVNQQLSDRVLTSWRLADGRAVLVMQDLDLTPLPALTPALVTQMGRTLCQFHQTVQLATGPVAPNDRFIRTADRLARLHECAGYPRWQRYYNWFMDYRVQLNSALLRQPVVSLHGDFGVRNCRYCDGRLILIDFERVKPGIAQEDVVKFFQQDLNGRSDLIQAFWNGYGASAVLDRLAVAWLDFDCALGIMTYVQQRPDPAFETVGQRLIGAVNRMVAGQK
ncbi:phosphotransferase [Lactiplantibacillus carotarum]|uniref:phosphotransferase n=1 Tax=Lactiplantibacillus carotarum TaxID=2993456 RepID=UPI00298EE19B|nr:phosphotransferase [Lactiplantibacillus carotarum]